jgi:hypothetical protein
MARPATRTHYNAKRKGLKISMSEMSDTSESQNAVLISVRSRLKAVNHCQFCAAKLTAIETDYRVFLAITLDYLRHVVERVKAFPGKN